MIAELAYEVARITAKEPILCIAGNSHQAYDILHQLRFFKKDDSALLFPDKEVLPYDYFSPHSRINSQRIKSFYRLLNQDYKILICAVDTLMERTPPPEYFINKGILLRRGQQLSRDRFISQLEQAAYRRVEQVQEPGSFALRGSLLDLFPTGAPLPYRMDWLDDEIDSLRSFSPEDQRSLEQIEAIQLLPAHEFPLSSEAKEKFRVRWQQSFTGQDRQHQIYQDLTRGFIPHGLENYLPFFFDKLCTLFDYLSGPHIVFPIPDYLKAAQIFQNSVQERYHKIKHNPTIEPSQLYLTTAELTEQLQQKHMAFQGPTMDYAALPPLEVNFRATNRIEALSAFITTGQRILLCLESVGREELLIDWLNQAQIPWKKCLNWQEFSADSNTFCLTRAHCAEGLINKTEGWALITETELFNERKTYRKKRKSLPPELLIRNLTQLEIGELVVHLDHGVGCFLGLKKITHQDYCQEYLSVEYAQNTTLYVPVSNLHLISRYIGCGKEERVLDHLGNQKWAIHKARAARKVQDTAAQLLDIYAHRAREKGLVFMPPQEDYHSFVARFPHQETLDQQKAINEILEDMLSDKKMDRLVCGDVGFGKTEVAMRAAYVAAISGYQVAVLVPTTLLAQQHLESFKERFNDTPCAVDSLTRMADAQDRIKARLAQGSIDIIIGTHSLLSKSTVFKRLGLVIIDEEHRFGVRQKEKLKALRSNVEVLSLTATPIPRTLNLALSGLRDISLIASPPQERLAVRTFVRHYDADLVKEAIAREMLRGGQIYYVFNNIAEIERRAQNLEQSFPNIRVEIIHGSLPKREMEKIMRDFYHNRFDLLVCTTIIENGIDVSNANTLIIERADKFGLAQLHQLRGRVGRRSHQAYAYLLTEGKVSADANKRLKVISDAQELGLGFTIATYDLEIRGAGEILGDEQSGAVEKIGLELYTHLLERAVYALKNRQSTPTEELIGEVEVCVNAYLPDEYIADVYERLTIYKRISNTDEAGLKDLRAELLDRFGNMLAPVSNLFELQQLRLAAQALGISKIKANSRGNGYLLLNAKDPSLIATICQIVQHRADQLSLTPQAKLRFQFQTDNEAQLLSTLNHLLESIEGARETNEQSQKRSHG